EQILDLADERVALVMRGDDARHARKPLGTAGRRLSDRAQAAPERDHCRVADVCCEDERERGCEREQRWMERVRYERRHSGYEIHGHLRSIAASNRRVNARERSSPTA